MVSSVDWFRPFYPHLLIFLILILRTWSAISHSCPKDPIELCAFWVAARSWSVLHDSHTNYKSLVSNTMPTAHYWPRFPTVTISVPRTLSPSFHSTGILITVPFISYLSSRSSFPRCRIQTIIPCFPPFVTRLWMYFTACIPNHYHIHPVPYRHIPSIRHFTPFVTWVTLLCVKQV